MSFESERWPGETHLFQASFENPDECEPLAHVMFDARLPGFDIYDDLRATIDGKRLRAHSAGSNPTREINPLALDLLKAERHQTHWLRSKSWDEFSSPGAPAISGVITLCDRAASEPCPVFTAPPTDPVTRRHWGLADPASGAVSFEDTYRELKERIACLVSELRNP